MTHHVRDGRPDDLPALRAVQERALAEPWTELLTLAADGGGPTLLVATDDGASDGTESVDGVGNADTPVGYGLAVTDEDDTVGYLVELAVAPTHQGEGYGSALVERLVDRFAERRVERLRVTVRAVDERAREFYRDRGFERRERLPDHYESGDGVLLTRDLS